MRPRKKDRDLPPCVYNKHGAYWYVKKGKWVRLGDELSAALREYARMHEQKRGDKAPIKQRHDRCIHPSGPHPQNEFCAWRTPKTEGVTA